MASSHRHHHQTRNTRPQITLGDQQSRILIQRLQNTASTAPASEPADSISETSQSSSGEIDSPNLNKASPVPKRNRPFRVIFDPDIHDVFSFTSCLRYLQPRPHNISKCLRGDAGDWHADLSAVIKAGINTCVGLWCHELEREYRTTAGQGHVPHIPIHQALKVHQPSSLDERPEPMLTQYTPKLHVNQSKKCRICNQSFISRSQLFNHLRAGQHHGRFDDIAPLTESGSEQASIASTSGPSGTTLEQCHTVSTSAVKSGTEIEQFTPKNRPNSQTKNPNQCRLCKEGFASGNQLHDHLRASHFHTVPNKGTSPTTPDNERISTTESTPETPLNAREKGRNVTTPVVETIDSGSTPSAIAQDRWPHAEGVRISINREAEPLSIKSAPKPATSIPTQCRICKEKLASHNKLHKHLKTAHKSRNLSEQEYQQPHIGRPITAF